MRRLRWIPRGGLCHSAVVSVVLSLACERSTPAAGRKNTAVTVVPTRGSSVVVRPEAVTWVSAACPALFVAGPTTQQACVIASRYTDLAALDSVRVDTSALQSLRLELFGSGR